MANVIKIKAGSGLPTTSDIVDRELAFDRSNNKLYINDSGNIVDLTGQSSGGPASTADRIEFTAQAGEALSKGDVVYISGLSGNTPIVSKADADDANKMPAFGLAGSSASLNNSVDIVTFGILENMDTSAFTQGDTLFVSTTPGTLSASKPSGETGLIQNIAYVVRSAASVGAVKIGGAGRTAATPNLNEDKIFIGDATDCAVPIALSSVNLTKLNNDLWSGSANQLLTDNGDGTATSESNLIFGGQYLSIQGNDPSNTYGVKEKLRIHRSGNNTDRQLQIYEMRHSGGREFLQTFNLDITTDNSTGYTYTQGSYGGSSYLEFDNAGALKIYNDSSVANASRNAITPSLSMWIKDDNNILMPGKLGIGWTAGVPARALDVKGGIELSANDNTLDTNNFTLRRDSGGGGNIDVPGNMTINLDANNNETTAQFEICHDGGSTPVFKVQENGYTTALRYYLEDTGAVIYRNSNDLELITYSGYNINLMPSGNVGIGVTSPTDTLQVEGSIGVGVGRDGQLTSVNNGLAMRSLVSDADMYFYVNDGGVDTLAMKIDASAVGTVRLPNDSQQLIIGANDDLRIQHNGSHSFIQQYGTGDLYIDNTIDDKSIFFRTDDGSGGVTTYLAIRGDEGQMRASKQLRMQDNVQLQVGSSGDFQLFHNTADTYATNSTGNLYIGNGAADKDIFFKVMDGTSYITALTIDASDAGTLLPNNNIRMGDSKKIRLGASNDFNLYHDGSNSYIYNESSAGKIIIQNTTSDGDIEIKVNDGGATTNAIIIDASDNSRVKLPNDNQRLSIGASNDIQITHDGSNSYFDNYTGNLNIKNNAIDGDIILSSDDGSGGETAYLTLDGSATSVNIAQDIKLTAAKKLYLDSGSDTYIHNPSGDTIDIVAGGQQMLRLFEGSTDYVHVDDNTRLGVGNDPDLTIYHTSDQSYISNSTGRIHVQNQALDQDIRFSVNDGGVTSNILTLNAASSRVGIGTTAPEDLLHVHSTGDTTVKIKSTSNKSQIRYQNDAQSWYTGIASNEEYFWYGSQIAGNAGFIQGSTGNLYWEKNVILSVNAKYLYSRDTGGTLTRMFGMNGSNTTYIGPIDSYAGGRMYYGASANMSGHNFYTGGTLRMKLDGYVLDLPNTGDWSSILNNTNSGGLRFGTKDAGGTLAYQIELSNTGNYVKLNEPTQIIKETSTTASATGTTLLTLTNDVGADLNQQKTFVDFTLLDDNSNETPQVRIGAEVGQNGDANSQEKEGSGAFVVYTNNADTTSGDAGASLAERMRVDYQGKLLIGDTSVHYSGTDLQVGNTSDSQNGIQIQTSTTGNGYVLFGDGTGASAYRGQIRYDHTNDSLNLSAGGSEEVYVKGGNVGLGVASPAFSWGTKGIEIQGSGVNPVLRLDRIDSIFEITARSTDILLYNTGTARSLRFGVGGAEKFRINSDGNTYVYETLILNANNESLLQRDTGGTLRNLIKLDSSNRVQIGHADTAGVHHHYPSTYSQINTDHGYLQIGPQNVSHCHYTTDRANHWFNQMIYVNGGIVSSYNSDLSLRRNGANSDSILIQDNTVKVYTDATNERFRFGSLNRSFVNQAFGPINNNSKAYIRANDGYSTSTTPDYTWWYNDQCGIYHPAGNTIGFSASGQKVLISTYGLYSADDIYIGHGGSDYSPGLQFMGGSNTPGANEYENAKLAYYDNSGTGFMRYTIGRSAGAHEWYIGGTRMFSFDQSGNLVLRNDGSTQGANIYRVGGVYFTWDRDTYGTANEHSIRTISDDIVISSYDDVTINLDSNNNDSASTFDIRQHNTDRTSGTLLFQVDQSGNARATADVVAYYSSDKRLKDNLKPISNSLEKLQKLTGYEFDWNKKQDTYEGHDVGVVAQEVEEVLPEVVATRDSGYKAVKYEKMIPLLIEAIKEQQQQINELKEKLNG